jgi:hypothetical protein
MGKLSRIVMIAMSTSFSLSALGLLFGMPYDLDVVFIRHVPLETVLGPSIPYYKTVGGLGILGMLFFFVFLLSVMAGKRDGKPHE